MKSFELEPTCAWITVCSTSFSNVTSLMAVPIDENRGALLEAGFPQTIVSLLEGYAESIPSNRHPNDPLSIPIPDIKVIKTSIGVILNACLGYGALHLDLKIVYPDVRGIFRTCENSFGIFGSCHHYSPAFDGNIPPWFLVNCPTRFPAFERSSGGMGFASRVIGMGLASIECTQNK